MHTGPQEHNHIDIKRAALKTQMNKKKLDFQTGHRVMERLFIQRAYDFVKTELLAVPAVHDPGKALHKASKATYLFEIPGGADKDRVGASFSWKNNKYDGQFPLHHAHIMRLLVMEFVATHAPGNGPGPQSISVPYFTEYERNGFVYRAHPNYRGEGAYYDWAFVQWET